MNSLNRDSFRASQKTAQRNNQCLKNSRLSSSVIPNQQINSRLERYLHSVNRLEIFNGYRFQKHPALFPSVFGNTLIFFILPQSAAAVNRGEAFHSSPSSCP